MYTITTTIVITLPFSSLQKFGGKNWRISIGWSAIHRVNLVRSTLLFDLSDFAFCLVAKLSWRSDPKGFTLFRDETGEKSSRVSNSSRILVRSPTTDRFCLAKRRSLVRLSRPISLLSWKVFVRKRRLFPSLFPRIPLGVGRSSIKMGIRSISRCFCNFICFNLGRFPRDRMAFPSVPTLVFFAFFLNEHGLEEALSLTLLGTLLFPLFVLLREEFDGLLLRGLSPLVRGGSILRRSPFIRWRLWPVEGFPWWHSTNAWKISRFQQWEGDSCGRVGHWKIPKDIPLISLFFANWKNRKKIS